MRWVHAQVARATASEAEGRDLAHINPDTIDGHLLVVFHNLVSPELVRFGVVPVREDGITRPDGSNILASIRVLQEDIVLVSPGVGIITESILARHWRNMRRTQNLRIRCVSGIWDVNSGIYNGNVMTTAGV